MKGTSVRQRKKVKWLGDERDDDEGGGHGWAGRGEGGKGGEEFDDEEEFEDEIEEEEEEDEEDGVGYSRSLEWDEVPDWAMSIVVGMSCCERLAEQDIWWQIRLGDEMLAGLPLPKFESWTYTSTHVPFHNHWPLSSLLFAATHALFSGLVLLRGVLCCLFFRLLLALRPRCRLRYPLAGLAFAVARHRLQLRPETCSIVIFLVLFVLPRSRGMPALRLFPTPSFAASAFFCVALVTNTHFGMVPFIGLGACITTAEALSGGGLAGPRGAARLFWEAVKGMAMAMPLMGLAVLLSPQPIAGIAYLVAHSPVAYHQQILAANPEMKPLRSDFELMLSPRGVDADGKGKSAWRIGSHMLIVWMVSSVLVPLIWLCKHRSDRPRGLRNPFLVLPAHVILVLLTIDRARNVLWSAALLAAMCGSTRTGSLVAGLDLSCSAKQHRVWQAKRVTWAAACAAAGLCLALSRAKRPSLAMALHNWPVESVAWVREHRTQGNVYHTLTFGGYIVWHLREYRLFADTREYCFHHLDETYVRANKNPDVLKQGILDEYAVNTFINLIPGNRQLPDRGFENVHERFMPSSEWARVYFDHVSEVMLRRIPKHKKLIERHEIKALNPSLPPDYFARILLGTETYHGAPSRKLVEKELSECMARKPRQVFCFLVHCLVLIAKGNWREVSGALRELESISALDIKNERGYIQGWIASTKIVLSKRLGIDKSGAKVIAGMDP